MRIAILQYPAGNVRSVELALLRLGVEGELTADPDRLRSADGVIFPGVGEASSAMAHLRAHGLDMVLRTIERPLLGICLGMQLLCTHSAEGDTEGLGIFRTRVQRFPNDEGLKVPQVGWNTITAMQGPLFNGLSDERFVYYVHGYYATLCADTVATTTYGLAYSAALARDNFFGTQFHPERSAHEGAQVLRNFLSLCR